MTLQPKDNDTLGKTLHVGAHTYLNSTNVAEYEQKYNLVNELQNQKINDDFLEEIFSMFLKNYFKNLHQKEIDDANNKKIPNDKKFKFKIRFTM